MRRGLDQRAAQVGAHAHRIVVTNPAGTRTNRTKLHSFVE
jgi:hypothetical protein